MATEEQTDVSRAWSSVSSNTSWGQKLTIPNRLVTQLSFYLMKSGSPTGTVTFLIRKVSDGSQIVSKLWGNSANISTTPQWYEVTFDSPVTINEEVYLLVTSSAQGGGHVIGVYDSNGADVKADEHLVNRSSGGSYTDYTGSDFGYIYTYVESTGAPSVTTQAASSITATTATGNGNVTNLGVPNATQYGHFWATHPDPTLDDNKTEKGVPGSTGAFTSSLTGLLPNTQYWMRAYVTNLVTTDAGALVSFTTSGGVPSVTTDPVTDVATTTALGNGSIDDNGGSVVTQHGVVWSTSANPDTSDSKTEDGATNVIGDFFSQITTLSANTLYHVRAYATNSSGTGYGADVTFTTSASGAPIVTTETTTRIKSTSALGNGTIVDVGGSTVTQHGHVWGTSVNPTTSNSKTTQGSSSTGTFTSILSVLVKGTIYYTRAYATNSFGTSYGRNVLFTTPNDSIQDQTAYIWMEGDNFRGFNANKVENKYVHTADVDDTPVYLATTDPISSNWAYDHGVATDPHAGYVLESLFDAKGDLISASADNTPARLAVGSDETNLEADSSEATGLKWTSTAHDAQIITYLGL